MQGTLVVIELKRGKTPREAVAQLLDYAAWAKNLSRQEITDYYSEFYKGASFDEATLPSLAIASQKRSTNNTSSFSSARHSIPSRSASSNT